MDSLLFEGSTRRFLVYSGAKDMPKMLGVWKLKNLS